MAPLTPRPRLDLIRRSFLRSVIATLGCPSLDSLRVAHCHRRKHRLLIKESAHEKEKFPHETPRSFVAAQIPAESARTIIGFHGHERIGDSDSGWSSDRGRPCLLQLRQDGGLDQ